MRYIRVEKAENGAVVRHNPGGMESPMEDEAVHVFSSHHDAGRHVTKLLAKRGKVKKLNAPTFGMGAKK